METEMIKFSNDTEALLYEQLTQKGWKILKKGWPDFACIKDGELMLIEVKPKRSHSLKKEQLQMLLIFAEHGIKSCRWTPDRGLEMVTAEMRIETAPCEKPPQTKEELIGRQSPRVQEEIRQLEAKGKDWY